MIKLKIESEFNLLVGYTTSMKETVKDIKIDEYKGKYERMIVKKEYLNNQSKGLTELISAITLRFGPYDCMTSKQAGKLAKCDRDLIILQLRLITDGKLFKYDSICSQCEKKVPRQADLLKIPVIPVDSDRKEVKLEKPIKLGTKEYKKAVITLPSGDCQSDFINLLNNNDVAGMKLSMLRHCVIGFVHGKEVDTPDIAEVYDEVSPSITNALMNDINEYALSVGPQLKVRNVCPDCSQEDFFDMPIANFF
jgi:hypothetical protein